ncbi:hypothetical protein R8G64_11930 [Tenacibaculum maritimum]
MELTNILTDSTIFDIPMGSSLKKMETLLGEPLFINQERDNNIIGSYNEVEFYFHKNKLNMWVVKIEEEMFFMLKRNIT